MRIKFLPNTLQLTSMPHGDTGERHPMLLFVKFTMPLRSGDNHLLAAPCKAFINPVSWIVAELTLVTPENPRLNCASNGLFRQCFRRLLVFQQSLGIQPLQEKLCPAGDRGRICLPYAKAMAHPR